MSLKSRVQKLEEKIKPDKKKDVVRYFESSDYKDQKEMDQSIAKWFESLLEDEKGTSISFMLCEESDEERNPITKWKDQENEN